jgi:hypothetical protein
MHRACAVVRRIALSAALGLQAEACMSWRTQAVSPEEVVARQPNQVRVTLANTSRMVIAHPAIIGDSLVGAPPGANSRRIAQRLGVRSYPGSGGGIGPGHRRKQ